MQAHTHARSRSLVALAGLTALLGCASAKTIEPAGESSSAPFPRPERVLVFEFAVNAGEVGMNRGLVSDAERLGDSARQLTAEEDALGHKTAAALADEIARGLGELGIEAIHVRPDTELLGPALSVDGHFLSIDEGDRAERVLIGFGAGGTHVRIAVQLDSLVAGDFEPVYSFETEADSSKLPGAATPLGVGAVTGDIVRGAVVAGAKAVGSEELSDSVTADVKRTAHQIVREVARIYAQHGWLDPAKVPKK